MSISEEKNRATKAMQEKTALLHKLHRANADLEGAQGELQRANEELTALREKVKTFHAARIAADKRVADASTAHSKTEVRLNVLVCCVSASMAACLMKSEWEL